MLEMDFFGAGADGLCKEFVSEIDVKVVSSVGRGVVGELVKAFARCTAVQL